MMSLFLFSTVLNNVFRIYALCHCYSVMSVYNRAFDFYVVFAVKIC